MRCDNNRKFNKIIKWVVITFVSISSAVLLRILVIDVYKVPSSSMEPTLLAGDVIVVSKLSYGARIIKLSKLIKQSKFDFYRLPGFSSLKRGDIVVFNPHKINYLNEAVYDYLNNISVKRCYTTSGHFTIIKNGNKMNGLNISKEEDLFPPCYRNIWSLDNYGPLYIPARDDSISLTKVNIQIYKHLITAEHPNIQIKDSIVFCDDRTLSFYKFKQDYFFVIGDNFYESIDSRYWGFVSDKDIIGKVITVLFSIDNSKKGFKKIRLTRVFKHNFSKQSNR